MASDKRKGQGPTRRRVSKPLADLTGFERLERRTLLTTSPTSLATSAALQGGFSSLVATPYATADTIPPKITNVSATGRIIFIQFSEAMNPSTINTGTVALLRQDGTDLLLTPGVGLTYSTTGNSAVIDLSSLPQTALPTSSYTVVVSGDATDTSGNHLDGLYQGYFPSGNGVAGTPFWDNLGTITLTAPVVTGLSIAAGSDSGAIGDDNTDITTPVFQGTVRANFPQATAGLVVAVQFSGYQANNQTTLSTGANGRGISGSPDFTVVTDANGFFSFQAPRALPNGSQSVTLVVIGQNDQPNAPANSGLSSTISLNFRVDTTTPYIENASIANGASISALNSLSLFAVDPVYASTPFLAVPTSLNFPALETGAADTVTNYALYNAGLDGVPGTADDVDYSSYIQTANYVNTTNRVKSDDPYTGRIDLTFATGLPSGTYFFVAKGVGGGGPFGLATARGLSDYAGNPLDNRINQPSQDFVTSFTLQPTPVYVTNYQAISNDAFGRYQANGTNGLIYNPAAQIIGNGPKAVYEIPNQATEPQARADAPPYGIVFDFSSQLDPSTVNNQTIQLQYSPDGVFDGAGNDSTFLTTTTVSLGSSISGSVSGQPGFDNRLTLLVDSSTLKAGHYRVVIANIGSQTLRDIYGQALDGEFIGSQNAAGAYQTLLPDGSIRYGLSGDAQAGGGFTTGFLVVPTGNVLFARADYTSYSVTSPSSSTYPNGSYTQPFQVLAPQATTTGLNNGNLNDPSLNGYDPNQDRAQIQRFAPSAFYAAQVLSAKGPVVIQALPSQFNTTQDFTFNLPPRVVNGVPLDGSASVPYNTTLIFQAGAVVRLFNASLFAQNQGTAIQALGTSNRPVIFTSFNDTSIGTAYTGQDPHGGDWGGVVYRNFDQSGVAVKNATPSQARDDRFPIDGLLKGANGGIARAGEDDALSILNFVHLSFGGGPVPQTLGTLGSGYDVVELVNSRPVLTNLVIANSGTTSSSSGATVAQAAVGADFDSFREDAVARGPLLRNDSFVNNSINGVLLRAQANGAVEQTNAIYYANNPTSAGGDRNFVFDDPLPYVVASNFRLGTEFQFDSNNAEFVVSNRTYIQPGMLFKFERGAGLDVDPLDGSASYWAGQALHTGGEVDRPTSLNIGDRNYIIGYDANHNYAPLNPDGSVNSQFLPDSANDARVLFTSFYDDKATTTYTNPATGVVTTIVPANDTANLTLGGTRPVPPGFEPSPGNVPDVARWGGISLRSGVQGIINDAQFQYGGGSVNTLDGTITQRAVLNFQDSQGIFTSFFDPVNPDALIGGTGTHVMVTNNNFYDNTDTPIGIDPDGLLAADPLRPLLSGKPFIRGNVLQRNDINGLGIVGTPNLGKNLVYLFEGANLDVNSVWDQSDITYVLRGTIVLDGKAPKAPSSTFSAEIQPAVTLTVQSSLANTLLPDGTRIAVPGESTIVKLLTIDGYSPPVFSLTQTTAATQNTNLYGGAGFIVGVDNGVDPPTEPLLDGGLESQIRFLGIGGNESTGQSRVPVVLTSLHDDSVGTTVRGVTMNQAVYNPTNSPDRVLVQAPAAGDGGVIYIGANSLFTYNLFDNREGSRIDNVDLRYMTRVEYQDGGIADTFTSSTKTDGNVLIDDLLGNTPATQNNAQRNSAITNSNFSNFSNVGIVEHAGFGSIIRTITENADGTFSASGYSSPHISPTFGEEGGTLYVANNTFSNIPIGIQILGTSDPAQPDLTHPAFVGSSNLVAIYNTFYNVPTGIQGAVGSGGAGGPVGSILAMDNIFSNSTTASLTTALQLPMFNGTYFSGIIGQSAAQYNLFNNSPLPAFTAAFSGGPSAPTPAITGDPLFVNPANGDFQLNQFSATGVPSAAIDAARSELSGFFGGLLQPIATQQADILATPIRNATNNSNDESFTFQSVIGSTSLVALGGLASRTFLDQFIAVLPGTPGASPGVGGDGAVNWFLPVGGERDQRGFLRQDDTNVPNVGFGAQPFFDLGAQEYRQLFPPEVTAVLATSAANPSGVNLYAAGRVAGSNQTPDAIVIAFNKPLDPSTINTLDVLLEGSAGTGNFSAPTFINLAGRLAFDPSTNSLVITTAGLNLTSDEYRVVLKGVGANVIRDPQGNALDGRNLDPNNNDPNTNQLPLPSGTGRPGSDFSVTFTIDTSAPVVTPGSFILAAASDTSGGLDITSVNTPTFTGNVTDVFPPANARQGLSVFLDVAVNGTSGDFNYLNVGSAVTDAAGNFSVTATTPLPDSPYNVGPDGFLPPPYTADNTGYSVARIRVFDQAGNMSTFNDPNSLFKFYIDTTHPQITATTPTIGSLDSPTSTTLHVTFNTSENINPSTLTAASIGIVGPDGSTPILAPGSIQIVPLFTGGGAEQISFDITGATVNGAYGIFLATSGANAVKDFAGNTLVANTPGGYELFFNVQTPINNRILWVSANNGSDAGDGTFATPFLTINEGITAARQGDIVAVLPGLYQENVILKSLVQVISASGNSTATSFLPGNALQTVIRPAFSQDTVFLPTVLGYNLDSIPTAPTVFSGFTISSVAISGLTTIVPSGTVGLSLTNSQVLVQNNYILDTDSGAIVSPYSNGHFNATFQNNVFAGNNVGLNVYAPSLTIGSPPVYVINNDFVFNNIGIYNSVTATSEKSLNITNNIFWQNDRAGFGGAAIVATAENKTFIQYNDFSFNHNGTATPADDTFGIGTGLGFNPVTLTATPNALGNFTAAPNFVAPLDPRPNSNGPAAFLSSANYDLKANSPPVGRASDGLAPNYDILYRLRNKGVNNSIPVDIGAFEYQASTGGTTSTTTTTGGSSGLVSSLAVTDSTATSAVTPAVTPTVTAASTPAVGLAQSLPTTTTPTPQVVTGTTHPNARQAHLQAISQARLAAHIRAQAALQARQEARAAHLAQIHARATARRV